MSKAIQLTIHLSDELGITAITFGYNDTDLPSNSETLNNIAKTIIRAIDLNKSKLIVDDLLSGLNIKTSDK